MTMQTYATRLDTLLQALGGRPDVRANPLLTAMVAETQTALEELRVQAAQLAEAEGALERERRRYRELFDFAPDAYFVTDLMGLIREANHAVSALVGYARGYVVEKPMSALVHPEDGALLATRLGWLRAAEGDRVQEFELRLRPCTCARAWRRSAMRAGRGRRYAAR